MKKKLMVLSSLVLVLGPAVAFADTTIGSVLTTITGILNTVIPILIIIAIIYFIWGVIKYVVSGDEEAKSKGRGMIIYGIIGLAVIVGVWGLVYILLNTFGISAGGHDNITTPTVPTYTPPVLDS